MEPRECQVPVGTPGAATARRTHTPTSLRRQREAAMTPHTFYSSNKDSRSQVKRGTEVHTMALPGSVAVPQGGAEGPPELPGSLGLSSEKLRDEADHGNFRELPFIPQRTLSPTKATGQGQGPVANSCPQKALPGIQASGGPPSSATALPPAGNRGSPKGPGVGEGCRPRRQVVCGPGSSLPQPSPPGSSDSFT